MRSLADYLALVPPLNAGDPNFMAELALVLQPFVDVQAFLQTLPLVFDLDTAIGVQLDATGAWIGQSREVPIPVLNPWFSFDITGLGFDQGYWWGPYQGEALASLDDDTYRRLLYAVVEANNCDGTLAQIEAALKTYFNYPGGTTLLVMDMTDWPPGGYADVNLQIAIGFAGTLPNAVDLSILGHMLIPIVPAAVTVNWAVTTANGAPVFGFDVQNSYVAGFDSGAWGASPEYVIENILPLNYPPLPFWAAGLPRTPPATSMMLWNNGGVISITTAGAVDPNAQPWVVALPTTPPVATGLPWNNGGFLCLSGGGTSVGSPSWVMGLPTTLPTLSGVMWNDGLVVSIS